MSGNTENRIYLDASIIILLIEGTREAKERLRSEFRRLGADQGILLVSPLTKLECLVKPIRTGDARLERVYRMFFSSSEIRQVEIGPTEWEKATRIRAQHGFRVPDALHLATAALNDCSMILTHDDRWGSFEEARVEVI